MKIVVFVLCEDHVYGGGRKSINSIKYFNPDFKIVRYGTHDINRLKAQYNCPDLRFINPLGLKEVWENENPDILIRLGSDCLVLGEFNEIIDYDYDVAAARNDADDIGNRDERHNRPDRINDIPNHEWVNADLIAIKNYQFVEKYYKQILDYWNNVDVCVARQSFYENGILKFRSYRGDCQSALNVVFRLGGLRTRILDPIGGNIYYGSSASFNSGNGYVAPSIINEYNGKFYNWSSWYDIEYINNQYHLNGKVVKNLHKGGGGTFKSDKLDIDLFNPSVREKIQKIMNNERN
jgi:hypothetical protein